MQQSPEQIVRAYFRLADSRDPGVRDLFADDVEFYFPRFGVTRGRDRLADFSSGYRRVVQQISHPQSELRPLVLGQTVVVEGTTVGQTATGTWRGGETPGGRFCSVFEVADERITRMYVYLDPDFASEHDLGFGWTQQPEDHW